MNIDTIPLNSIKVMNQKTSTFFRSTTERQAILIRVLIIYELRYAAPTYVISTFLLSKVYTNHPIQNLKTCHPTFANFPAQDIQTLHLVVGINFSII